MIDLIVSQGRVGDRAARMIEGAARTARALEKHYGLTGTYIGEPAPAVDDDWTASLPQARETLLGLGEAVAASLAGGNRPVMVANTCSASLATLPAVASARPDAVVLYIDAHGDFNTPDTTKTGYLGGMVLSGACGLWDSGHGAGLCPTRAVLVGSRDIDDAERELLHESGVRLFPPAEADTRAIVDSVGDAPVWVHVDWDVMDPRYVPADYSVPDGMSPDQIHAIFEAIPPSQLVGVEVAEFNAPADAAESAAAVAMILAMLAPVFETA